MKMTNGTGRGDWLFMYMLVRYRVAVVSLLVCRP